MSKPVFVYTIYIASTPEKVFKALTDTDVTARFWFGNAVTSDWKVGAPVEFRRQGELIVQGKVLEYDPPRRIIFQHFALHDQFALATEFDRRADLPVRGDGIAEPESCGHIGIGQRLEDFLGRRRNVD